MKKITLSASKTYDIIIGEGILEEAGSIIRKTVGGQSAVIVSDDNVAKLYGEQLVDTLTKNNYKIFEYIFPNGESSKKSENFISILNYLAEKNIGRTDVVVALGGGVTGDLAGFVAACYMRGIRFVQIPTTLLAAVDSSVGGKTGINLSNGKNLVGAFYQPDSVICDIDMLSTLDETTLSDGYAEIIKYGIIADSKLFDSLKNPINNQFEDVIARCVEIKRDIVAQDEFENNKRRLLNLGHTVGHAIEKLSNYQISHGHAIAVGMAIVTRAAFRMKMCSFDCLNDILKMLEQYKLPINTNYKADELARACLADKKRDGDIITMVFPVEIGECILKDVSIDELVNIIQLGLEEA